MMTFKTKRKLISVSPRKSKPVQCTSSQEKKTQPRSASYTQKILMGEESYSKKTISCRQVWDNPDGGFTKLYSSHSRLVFGRAVSTFPITKIAYMHVPNPSRCLNV